MKYISGWPAYGRNLKSKAEVVAYLRSGKDIVIADHRGETYANLEDLNQFAPEWVHVNLRIGPSRTKVVSVTRKDLEKGA